MTDWHDPSCRRLDLVTFDGTASCMSCGSVAPEADLAPDESRVHEIYWPIEETDLRLLVLEPGDFHEPLHCRLTVTSVLESPAYDAISYTWTDESGDATKSGTVRLNAQAFPITRNCESVMRRVRRQYSRRTIWVDAICIDQENDREKGHQVRLMPQIYSKAREVLIYIGEFETALDKYFLQDLEAGQIDWVGLGRTSVAMNLLERRYFSRVWALQEVALAKKATLICGNHSMPWLSFLRGMVRQAPDLRIRLLPAVLRFEQPTYRDWTSVLDLLDFARGTEASDARDKIYAVFGLIACAESEGLVADYTVPVEVANLRMACWLAQRFGLPELIARAFHSQVDGQSTPGLQWVPDWSKRTTTVESKSRDLWIIGSRRTEAPDEGYTLSSRRQSSDSVWNMSGKPLPVCVDIEARAMRLTACRIGTLETVCRQSTSSLRTRVGVWEMVMQKDTGEPMYWKMRQPYLSDDEMSGWFYKNNNGLPLDAAEERLMERHLLRFTGLQSCQARLQDEVFVVPARDDEGCVESNYRWNGMEAELSCTGDFRSFEARLTTSGQSPRLVEYVLVLSRHGCQSGEFLLRGIVYIFQQHDGDFLSGWSTGSESRAWEPSKGVFEEIKILA